MIFHDSHTLPQSMRQYHMSHRGRNFCLIFRRESYITTQEPFIFCLRNPQSIQKECNKNNIVTNVIEPHMRQATLTCKIGFHGIRYIRMGKARIKNNQIMCYGISEIF